MSIGSREEKMETDQEIKLHNETGKRWRNQGKEGLNKIKTDEKRRPASGEVVRNRSAKLERRYEALFVNIPTATPEFVDGCYHTEKISGLNV